MYEGFLQHDAQEVLQCILGYMQEACDTIRKEQDSRPVDSNTEIEPDDGAHPESSGPATEPVSEEENQVSGKRKSDTEVGNAKKKPKSAKSKKAEDSKEEMRSQPLTRSKRRSSSDVTKGKDGEGGAEAEDKEIKKPHKEEEEGGGDGEDKGKKASKEADGKTKKKARLRWLRPSGKQPSIFSKFRSVGKISCTTPKNPNKAEEEEEEEDKNGLKTSEEKTGEERPPEKLAEDEKAAKLQGRSSLLLQLNFTFTP